MSYSGSSSLIMVYPLLWMVGEFVEAGQRDLQLGLHFPSDPNFSAYIEGLVRAEGQLRPLLCEFAVIAVLAVIGNLMACSLAAYAFARLNFKGGTSGSR